MIQVAGDDHDGGFHLAFSLTKRGAKIGFSAQPDIQALCVGKITKPPPPPPRDTEIHKNANSQLTIQLSTFIGTHTFAHSTAHKLALLPSFPAYRSNAPRPFGVQHFLWERLRRSGEEGAVFLKGFSLS